MSAAGVRSTRQRAAISTLLETLDDFRSAQELHDELRRRGENIGLTTVYRTLHRWHPPDWWTHCTPTPVNRSTADARSTITTIWCAAAAVPPSK